MALTVTGTTTGGIVIGASGLEEIAQNVRTILTTIKGTVFLDRQFGIGADIVDLPEQIALIALRENIIEQIEKYEPRVNVLSVNYESIPEAGAVVPVVKYEIKEGVLL